MDQNHPTRGAELLDPTRDGRDGQVGMTNETGRRPCCFHLPLPDVKAREKSSLAARTDRCQRFFTAIQTYKEQWYWKGQYIIWKVAS